MLASAHQGYIYQDILGAYLVATELAGGRSETKFVFDKKKTPQDVPDRFDDLAIYRETETLFIQVKYSNDENQHRLTKKDFSASSSYDLALYDLFETWKTLNGTGVRWRICLAWEQPSPDDPIIQVLTQLPGENSILPGTTCYKFNIETLWPEKGKVLSSWKNLKARSASINRSDFKKFLGELILEVGCPKSTLLVDYGKGLEKLLSKVIDSIGIGVYPNDHLTLRQVAESICTLTCQRRAITDDIPISCYQIAKFANIELSNGGIEEIFPINESLLINTSDRLNDVLNALELHQKVVLTGEPGAGKSWFIENLERSVLDKITIVKHYCYTSLEDPGVQKRITVNTLYGSLITQILENEKSLQEHLTQRYASNLDQLNILLRKIASKTLVLVDGLDHVGRIYQQNRGTMREDQTTILKALAELDLSNRNVSLLVISQPIAQLSEHLDFFHCTLTKLPIEFVSELLAKNNVENVIIGQVSLANLIHEKSEGNALYCKYLIDCAISKKTITSFEWMDQLPAYKFNLTSYYQYLFEQIGGDTSIPYALCGATFSLTVQELKEITHLGNVVNSQISHLLPVLNSVPAIGYSIYHESFKRFIIDSIITNEGSIEHLVYKPLMSWLEGYDFYKSTKAFAHLPRMYYEAGLNDRIIKIICKEFVENSLYNAQPIPRIIDNHKLQRVVLTHAKELSLMVIVSEQARVIRELEYTEQDQQISYLNAVQALHGDQMMYRALWDGQNLLLNKEDTLAFLVDQAISGNPVVHWSIVPNIREIRYDKLGLLAIKMIHTQRYEDFETFLKKVLNEENQEKILPYIVEQLEWWSIYNGSSWKTHTPYFIKLLEEVPLEYSSLQKAISSIIEDDRFSTNARWRSRIANILKLINTESSKEVAMAIDILKDFNWFRNWLIYLIKIKYLSVSKHSGEDILDAFNYLVRDLDPFKGSPRVPDLHAQLQFIRKSFHQGLMLCNGNEILIEKCCRILEKVTDVSTNFQGAISGPLTSENYLDLISKYLPATNVIKKYEEYYESLGSRRVYSYVANTAFKYSRNLAIVGRIEEAEIKFAEGIQAMTAYGYRNDRTLSEILDCSRPFQQNYGSLTAEWFFGLYEMSMTVVTHTDGKSTNRYPVEWFEQFIQVFPNEAIQFLTSETLENDQAIWHQEEQFLHVLEQHSDLFSPTNWFLLAKSAPLATSEEILAHGLANINNIDANLSDSFRRWLQRLPFKLRPENSARYSPKLSSKYEETFGVSLSLKKKDEDIRINFPESTEPDTFPDGGTEEIVNFFQNTTFEPKYVSAVLNHLSLTHNTDEKRSIIRAIAKSFPAGYDSKEWLDNLFGIESEEWLYLQICLFVYLTDGWYQVLYEKNALKAAYRKNQTKCLEVLIDELGHLLSESRSSSSYVISGNLISALSELQIDEEIVKQLLDLTLWIIKRRLPHPPDCRINSNIYNGLIGMDSNEVVVAILISRLKTLTTEKTQNIIWSLTYIAKTNTMSMIRPYLWAFSNRSFLLPIHRAVLLQILRNYVSLEMVPDSFIKLLLDSYPTGFFLEDQHIRYYVNFNINLGTVAKRVIHAPSEYDVSIFPMIHPKYLSLLDIVKDTSGAYNAFDFKRSEVIKRSKKYYIREIGTPTPIVSLANAAYEVINEMWYNDMKSFVNHTFPANTCDMEFLIPEILIQVGSLSFRPQFLPTSDKIKASFYSVENPITDDDWVILAAREQQWSGDDYGKKECVTSLSVLTFDNIPSDTSFYFATYAFNTNFYDVKMLAEFDISQPICELDIHDQLERSNTLFVSPWVIHKLGLTVDPDFHNGFNARDSAGEVIVKLVTWKEKYIGSLDDGTEFPTLDGVSVMIKKNRFSDLISLYKQDTGHFVSKIV